MSVTHHIPRMVNFPQPIPWYQEDVGKWVRRLRATGELAIAAGSFFVLIAASVFGLLVGIQLYRWAIDNPAIALFFALYIGVPLGLLWVVVRVVRHAWGR